MATDLEVGIRYEVTGVETDTPGAAVLPVARFGSILRESSDATFRIESGNDGTTIRGERSQFKLPSENPQDFPPIAEFGESSYYEVSARLFRELDPPHDLRHRQRKQPLRPRRHQARVERQRPHRRRHRRPPPRARWTAPPKPSAQPAPFGDVTVVPTRAMNLLERALGEDGSEVQIAIRQNDILVKNPRATIYSRLLEGRYPRWRDVFPAAPQLRKNRPHRRPGPLRRPPSRDRHQRRKPRHRFHVRRRHPRPRRPNRRSRPIAHRAADRLRRPNDLDHARPPLRQRLPESPRTRKSFTIDLQDSDAAAVCTTDDGYGYVIMPLARDR